MIEKIFKKGIKKRLFSVVLALAMVLAMMPETSLAVYAKGFSTITVLSDFNGWYAGSYANSYGYSMTCDNIDEWYTSDGLGYAGWDAKMASDLMKSMTWLRGDNPDSKKAYYYGRIINNSFQVKQDDSCFAYFLCENDNMTVGTKWVILVKDTDRYQDATYTKDDIYLSGIFGQEGVDIDVTSGSTHTHGSWEYTANGATLTAECKATTGTCNLNDGTGAHKVSLILTATSANYSGITGLDDFNTATGKTIVESDVKFYKVETEGATTGGSLVEGTPTEAGYYYASLTVEGATAVNAFTIEAPALIEAQNFTLTKTSDGYKLTANAVETGFENDYWVVWWGKGDNIFFGESMPAYEYISEEFGNAIGKEFGEAYFPTVYANYNSDNFVYIKNTENSLNVNYSGDDLKWVAVFKAQTLYHPELGGNLDALITIGGTDISSELNAPVGNKLGGGDGTPELSYEETLIAMIDEASNYLTTEINGVTYKLFEALPKLWNGIGNISSIRSFIDYLKVSVEDSGYEIAFGPSGDGVYAWYLQISKSTPFLGALVDENGNFDYFAVYNPNSVYSEDLPQFVKFKYCPPTNEHTWSYVADGAILKAYCTSEDECNYKGNATDLSKAISLTLSASSPNNTGTAATITIGTTEEQTAWESAGLIVPTVITYAKADGTDLGTTAPTTIGNYVAKISPVGVDVSDANTAKTSFYIGIPLNGITLNKSVTYIKVGDSETLTVSFNPSDASNTNVTWQSSNTDVATVDNNGKITAKAVGTAIITATSEDGSKTATCNVNVKANTICPDCHGTGQVPSECTWYGCNGTGQQNCSECNGTGVDPLVGGACYKCHGEKKYTCVNCDGIGYSGTKLCTRCGGKGTLHNHTWSYAVDGTVLKAYCTSEDACDHKGSATDLSKAVSLTLTATASNYPGEAPAIQFGTTDEQTKWNAAGAPAYNTGTFKYFKSTGEGSTTSADNIEINASAISAGNYVAEYTISGVTVKIPVKVLFNTHSTENCTKFAGFTYIRNDWYCYNTDSGLNHKVFVGDKLNKTSIAMEPGSEVWVDRDKAIYYKTEITAGEIVAIDGSKIYICTYHAPGEGYCNSCGRNSEGSLMDKAYFIELINNATAGSTIKLEKDYVIDYPIVIDKELTLDLNGYKVKSTKAITAMFAIRENGKLTVTDTSTAQTGKLEYTANSNSANAILYVDGGELIVDKGIFEVIGNSQQITQTVSVLAGKATINSGSFTASGNKNSSVVACTKQYANKDSELIINGGTFSGSDLIKPFCSYKNTSVGDFGKVYINGGLLKGTLSTDSSKNIPYVFIKGGIFTQDWSKNGTDNEGQPIKKPLSEIISLNSTFIANDDNTYSVHSWNYTQNGALLTATCNKECGSATAHTATLTLTAPISLTYSGSAKVATLTDTEDKWATYVSAILPTITYYKQGDTTALTDAPSNAGTYTAKVTVGTDDNVATATINFEITKASVDAPTSLTGKVTVNYVNETITLAAGYEISTTDGENFVAITQTDHKITLTPGTTYYVRIAADTNHKASGTISCTTVARPTAPTTLSYSKTDTTITVNAINGVEYSIDNGATWTSGTTVNNQLVVKYDGLTADSDYTILSRAKATTTTSHSENLSTTIKTKKATPADTTTLFKVSVPSIDGLIYSASSKEAAVTSNDGIEGLGLITVKYYKDGIEVTNPKDVGTYVVKASAVAGESYNAIPEVAVGEFTITQATLTGVSVNQKANTEPTYNGSELTLQVETSATSVNNQTVTFVYSLNEEGPYTSDVPKVTDVGTYTIYYKASANNHEETADSFTVKVKPKVATSADILIPNTTLVGDGLTQVEIKAEDLLVKIANKTLVLDTDYELSGNKASSIGKHTLTIKFIGNYSGTITKEWMINEEVQTPVNVDLTKEEVEYKGNLSVTVTGDKDAPLITVNTPLDVLTDNDKTALKSSNTDIDIILTLKNKTADDLTEGSKDAIKDKGINLDNLTFLDITLDKVIRTKDSNGNVNTITESLELTPTEISITIDVPKSIANKPSGYNRTYSIIRSHKNADNTYTVDTLTTTYSNGTLTFKTDKFSDYVVSYVDTLIPTPSNSRPAYKAPNTNVSSTISSKGFVELGAIAIGSMIGIISSKKKKEHK